MQRPQYFAQTMSCLLGRRLLGLHSCLLGAFGFLCHGGGRWRCCFSLLRHLFVCFQDSCLTKVISLKPANAPAGWSASMTDAVSHIIARFMRRHVCNIKQNHCIIIKDLCIRTSKVQQDPARAACKFGLPVWSFSHRVAHSITT